MPSPASVGNAARGSIVFEGPIEGGAGIRIVGTDGIGDHWLFPDVKLPKDGWQVHPDWSPDGTRLAFAADDPADPPGAEFTRDLWVGDADGANARRVFDCVSPCIEAEDPAWSPDGRMLAFATWGPQPASLAVLDLATSSISFILTVDHDPDAFRHPRWSPDGRRIERRRAAGLDYRAGPALRVGPTTRSSYAPSRSNSSVAAYWRSSPSQWRWELSTD